MGPGRGAGRGAPSNPASTPGGGDTGSAQTTTTTAVVASTSTIFSSFSGHIKEEYDPMRPNEYEQVSKGFFHGEMWTKTISKGVDAVIMGGCGKYVIFCV